MPRLRAVTAPSRALALGLVIALHATAALAQVDRAEQALRELEYAAALKALEAARRQVGNSRATTVRILELQAVTLATMGQDARALKAFQQLLCLVPDYQLAGNHPPRVSTALYEARGWLDANRALTAQALPATKSADGVSEVQVEVTNDPLKLVKELRFHLEVDGVESVRDVALAGARALAPVSGRKVAWWAELLGEKKAVLLAVGSAAAPRLDEVPAPKPVAKTAKAGEPTPPPPAVERVEEKPVISEWSAPAPSRPMPTGRIAGLAVAGAGVVAAGAGLAFGAMAQGTKAQVTSAQTDAAGRITSLTQAQALALDAQQRTQATLANVFIISGAALAAGGVTLFLISRDDAQVALSPAPGGAVVRGRF